MAFHRGLNEFELANAVNDIREVHRETVDHVGMAALAARLADVDETPPVSETRASLPAFRVLYVDDHDSEAKRISAAIHDCPTIDVALVRADCSVSAKGICEAERIDVVVVDFWVGAGTTADDLDDLCQRCSGGVVVLSSLDADVVGRTIGEAEDLIVLSKSELDGTTFERAFRAIGQIN